MLAAEGGEASETSSIVLRNVECVIGGRRVFDGLNLEMVRGRITAIMGPSGTGKTTLLRLITGQVRPDCGQVLVDGEDVAKLRARELYRVRLNMGVLFQEGALFTDLDAFENVAFPLVAARGKPAELRGNSSPIVRQFMNGLRDGPVTFHYPAPDYRAQLLE